MYPEDEGIGIPSDPYDEVLEEYSKKSILDSINVMGDYIKMMITLASALIPSYFAILKFLGIEKIGDNKTIDMPYITSPAVFLLLSLAAFITASFPVPRKLTMDNPDNIKEHRKFSIIWKYTGIAIGSVFFWIGMALMISILLSQIN